MYDYCISLRHTKSCEQPVCLASAYGNLSLEFYKQATAARHAHQCYNKQVPRLTAHPTPKHTIHACKIPKECRELRSTGRNCALQIPPSPEVIVRCLLVVLALARRTTRCRDRAITARCRCVKCRELRRRRAAAHPCCAGDQALAVVWRVPEAPSACVCREIAARRRVLA